MKSLLLGVLLIAAGAGAQPAKRLVVTVKGKLSSAGRPVAGASLSLQPMAAQSAVELEPSGQFTLKVPATSSYVLRVYAEGFAPIEQPVELGPDGSVELGALKLEPLREARASVVVGGRDTLGKNEPQPITLSHGACATVAAQDQSACQLTFCVEQEGADLVIDPRRSGSYVRSLGKVALADAMTKVPRGTHVSGAWGVPVTLVAGETLVAQHSDPYCATLVHIEGVKSR